LCVILIFFGHVILIFSIHIIDHSKSFVTVNCRVTIQYAC